MDYHAVFPIMHNCRSVTQRFQIWCTEVWPMHNVDAHIFSAIKMIDVKLEGTPSKIQKSKPCLPNQIPFHSADWFKSTSRCSFPILIGWKFFFFPCYLCSFAITANLAERCEHVLGHKIWLNSIEATDKQISSSMGAILATLQCAPPLLILCRWNQTSEGLLAAFHSSCLVFIYHMICWVQWSA